MVLSELPTEIQNALGPLTPALATAHVSPVTWVYSERAFGSFLITFRSPRHEFTLTRDRGQFIIGGADRKSLEEAGLLRAFDTAEDLLPYLSSWLGE